MLCPASYLDVRDQMRPGDVVAFGGFAPVSAIIKWATRSCVSHVGTVLHTQIPGDGQRYFNQLIESTRSNGGAGVQINRLSDRLAVYRGDVWWLPLSEEVRAVLDLDKFWEFMFKARGKSYDVPGALRAGTDLLQQEEDFSKFFCSELVAGALEAAGALPPINASETTPIELCRMNVYSGRYYQLAGRQQAIGGYNRGGQGPG
jgi:hypothetical protein